MLRLNGISSILEIASAFLGTMMAAALIMASPAKAQTLTTLYNFQGPPADGSWPCAGVLRDATGDLLGTTQFGGSSDYGVIFKLGTTGTETVVHSFTGGKDGQNPCAPLTAGPNNQQIGTTSFGGYAENGTLFAISNDRLSATYDFRGGTDGYSPSGAEYFKGFVYGTTPQGGGGSCPGGCGTIFRLDKFGHETVLYTFEGPDGAYPAAGLLRDLSGNLYGTTEGGGADGLCPPYGCGTVFKLDSSGRLTVLHSFIGGPTDGWFVVTGLVLDSAGNLFGTTSGGGAWDMGTIYEIPKNGEERVIYSFSGPPDGATPNQLLLAANGKLYGSTYTGGSLNCYGLTGGCGTIFEADTGGNEKVLYRFGGVTDGAQPSGPITLDPQNNMYGTTQSGAKDGCTFSHAGCGTLWKLTLPSSDAP